MIGRFGKPLSLLETVLYFQVDFDIANHTNYKLRSKYEPVLKLRMIINLQTLFL